MGYTGKMSTKDEKKITNEKPISLFPLNFNEAVAAIMKVKPEPKKEKKKPTKKKKTGK